MVPVIENGLMAPFPTKITPKIAVFSAKIVQYTIKNGAISFLKHSTPSGAHKGFLLVSVAIKNHPTVFIHVVWRNSALSLIFVVLFFSNLLGKYAYFLAVLMKLVTTKLAPFYCLVV